MANVLGELFSEIANAIREKTGDTATMKPAEFPAKISSITVGGSSEVAVVAEKEYLFAKNGAAYYSMPNIDSNLVAFELVADKEYRVMWDGTSYTCTAMRAEDPAGVFIGSPAMLGIPMDTGEPFLVGVMDDGTPAIVTTDGAGDTTTHTVGVYTEGSGGGGGGGVAVYYGNFTPSARTGPYTVTHNWGIRPDCIIFTGYTNGDTDNNDIVAGFGVSKKFKEMFPTITNGLSVSRVRGAVLMNATYDSSYGYMGHIDKVTENSFEVGSSSVKVFNATYQYILIAIQ